jgi:hypothetical protein
MKFSTTTFKRISCSKQLYIVDFVKLQIFALYVTRSLNAVVTLEHRREICRYIYNHQAWHRSMFTHT